VLTDILEKNQPGNIKLLFETLYISWMNFNHLFVASSLLSTALWYQANNCSSLINHTDMIKAQKSSGFLSVTK